MTIARVPCSAILVAAVLAPATHVVAQPEGDATRGAALFGEMGRLIEERC